MSTNPFKAFTAFTCSGKVRGGESRVSEFKSVDPSGGLWSTIGMVPVYDGPADWIHNLDGAGHMLMVQINERILPGKVRDEKLKVEVAKVEKAEGRKISKKEYAQLRDQVEFDLLPKAFIRRTQIPVVFMSGDWLLIGSASATKVDRVVLLLIEIFGPGLKITPFMPMSDPAKMLTELVEEGEFDFDEGNASGEDIQVGSSAVVKGEAKEIVRFKDLSVSDVDLHKLLTSGHRVTELAIDYYDGSTDDPTLSFVLNESFVFKRLALPGTQATKFKGDEHGFAYMAWRTYLQALKAMVKYMGGVGVKVDDEEEEL